MTDKPMPYNRVKIARAISEQDLRAFAKETGHSYSFISRVENRKRSVPEKLKDYCDLTIQAFVTDEIIRTQLLDKIEQE